MSESFIEGGGGCDADVHKRKMESVYSVCSVRVSKTRHRHCKRRNASAHRARPIPMATFGISQQPNIDIDASHSRQSCSVFPGNSAIMGMTTVAICG